MRKLLLTFAILSVFCASVTFAQTQSGVVKTRGKMVGGKLVPGTLLQGATVQVEGRQAVVAKNGKFSFPVKEGKYTLKSVSKQGYRLVDAEACRQYSYSANPLQIVMEEPDKLQSDQLAKERKLRRELQRRIQQREDEIDALNVSVEEKNKLLVQLNKQREENENIIKDMAAYYATLDYDQLDAFQQSVSALLEECQLERADSLLRTRGDIAYRVRQIRTEQEAIAREQAALAKRKKSLEESKVGTQRKLEAIAADCYNFYQRFFMAHQNDSAAYYLELRASLDTTNVEWLREAGNYIRDYLADYDKAEYFLLFAYRQALAQYGENDKETALCILYIGELYTEMDEFKKALEYEELALSIFEKMDGETKNVSICYSSLGHWYSVQRNFEKSEYYYNKAIDLINNDSVRDILVLKAAVAYSGVGSVNIEMGNYIKAISYYDSAIEIYQREYGKEHFFLANCYFMKGRALVALEEFQEAARYMNLAIEIDKKILGDKHPDLGAIYNNLSNLYKKVGDSKLALECCQKALDIYVICFGHEHSRVASSYYNMAIIYGYKLKDYDKGIIYINKAKEIYENINGEENDYVAKCLKAMGDMYDNASKHDSAMNCYQESLNIMKKLYGEEHVNVAQSFADIGFSCFRHGEMEKGVYYFGKGTEIYEAKLGKNHKTTQKAKEILAQMNQKLAEQESTKNVKNKQQKNNKK